ncbi:MAG: D-alanine--D-alanine ligase [Parcubacteria group bacterium]|nr:D-alanine--D-alanine ligase [Parcubacteria group bacterium]
MKIGITFNLRKSDNERNAVYDSPITIEAIKKALQARGHQVKLYEANSKALFYNLALERPQIVFNMAEGNSIFGEIYVPIILDELKIPYTGSSPVGISLALNKVAMKRTLANIGLPVPKLYQVISSIKEPIQPIEEFPVIVKPIFEGASIGISSKSICFNFEQVQKVTAKVLERLKKPVMIEQFIDGKEVTIGVLGNFPPQIFPPMEIDFSPLNKKEAKASSGIQTFKFKTDYSEKASYYLPARFSSEILSRITDTVAKAFTALNLRDVTRFDARVDQNGVPYILEANAIVGLEPNHSDFPRIYKFLNKSYDDLINDILAAALERLKRNERVNY